MSSNGVSTGNDRFNSDATNWDSNPIVQEATRLAFQTLKPIIQQLSASSDSGLDVLEVGCGTGLLTLQLAPLVKDLVAVDPAPGMIEMLQAKLESRSAEGPQNILPLCLSLTDAEDPMLPPAVADRPSGTRRKFDLIVSHLVLHHVPDLAPFLRALLSCLKPGGRVALTDFEDFGPDAMYFHPPSKLEGVERHGIKREWMADLMRSTGFTDVKVWVGWTMDVTIQGWEGAPATLPFPFLVCEGTRP